MKLVTSKLHDLSTVAKKLHKPWWNDECLEACTNVNKFKYLYTKARRIKRENMRKSWRDYVTKLNHKALTNKVWDGPKNNRQKKSSHPLSN